MSFSYYTKSGCRFRGIPLTFNSLEPSTHELACGVGERLTPSHERIISLAQFAPAFVNRVKISALPTPAGRTVQFGGARICFDEARGQAWPVPAIVERSDGLRCLVFQALPPNPTVTLEADELVITRVALKSRRALALNSVVDQLVCLHQENASEIPGTRCAVQRLDLAWALADGLRARDIPVRFSGVWSRLESAVPSRTDCAVKLCPVDGHLRRLRVDAFVSSIEAPLPTELVGARPHYVVKDIGTVEELRDFFVQAGRPRLIGPAHLLEAIDNLGLSISTTVSQASFDW